jgi:Leucine-rich repeat (LRR) protein
MKKRYLLLSVLYLIYWGCEEDQLEKNEMTLPAISISSNSSDQSVNEIVTITVTPEVNEGIRRVEFYINDSLLFTDTESPYHYDWNTTQYENFSEHILKIISYNNSDNFVESQPILLTIDNSGSVPTQSELYPILYYDGFHINWSQNNDNDFYSYKLYESLSEDMSNQTLIFETTQKEVTNYVVNNLNNQTYYQITSEDIYGLQSISNIEVLLTQVELWGESYSVLNTTEIILVNNGLTGSIPTRIGNLTNLNVLILGGNQLSGEIPTEIVNLTNLTTLNLQTNQLTGPIPSEIGSLTNLETLSLLGNQLTGAIPTGIGSLTNLIELGLSSNQLSGIIPDEICNQGDSSLDLSNNNFCPPYPSCIDINVEEQNLIDCDDVVEIWGEYYSIEYTTEINLSNGGLTGEIPSELWYLTNLESLNLYNNQLTGSIPSELGNLVNLKYLVLWANQFTGEIPVEIGNLNNLIRLDLDENQFTGSIPMEIWNLTNLKDLFLSTNQLTGEIPPEIGNLTNLTYFFSSNNQLTGFIPTEIGDLDYLKYLRLNNNQLSGEIPESICNLNIYWNISYDFNISNNQFCPPYPYCIEDSVGDQDTDDCN